MLETTMNQKVDSLINVSSTRYTCLIICVGIPPVPGCLDKGRAF